MSTKKTATFNAILLGLQTLIELFLSYFYIIILTRALGAAGLGEYYYIITIVTTVMMLQYLNHSDLLIKRIAQNESTVSQDMGCFISIRFLMALVLCGVVAGIGLFSSRGHEFKTALWISAAYGVSLILSNFLETVAKAHQNVRPFALARVLEKGLALLFLYTVLMKSQINITAAITIVTGASLIQLVFLCVMTRKYMIIDWRFPFQRVVRAFRDSAPYFIGSLFGVIYYKTDVLVLGFLRSNEEVGYYAAPLQIYQFCLMTIAAVNTVIYPPLITLYKQGLQKFRPAVHDITRYLAVFLLGMAFGLLALSEEIIYWVFGESFGPSVWVLRAFAVMLLFAYPIPMFNTVLIALDRQLYVSFVTGSTAVINVVASLILIPKYSFHGAVYATMISIVMAFLLLFFAMRRYMNYRLPWTSIIRAALAAGCMFAAVRFLADKAHVFVLVLAGTAIYGISLLILRYFNDEDRAFLKSFLLNR